MSGEYIDRKEFHEALDQLKEDLREDIEKVQQSDQDDRVDLRRDFQEMKEAFYNGVKSSVKEHDKKLSKLDDRLNSIESKIDRASGGLSTLKMLGAVLGSAITSVGTVIGVLYKLGALAHWG